MAKPAFPNQFHGKSSFHAMSVNDWGNCWKNGKTGFHLKQPHPLMVKHLDRMLEGRRDLKILFPLCGKDVGMKWLADKGHTVIGIECVEQACMEFFEDQGEEYTKEYVPAVKGYLFKSVDGRIRIYQCDLFDFTADVEGQVDAIWDRGAYVALPTPVRVRYASVISSLMSPSCRYLLFTVDYDETQFVGPPYNIPEGEPERLYGKTCVLEVIDDNIDMRKEEHIEWGVDRINVKMYTVRHKEDDINRNTIKAA